MDIEVTIEKYIWHKSNIMTTAQGDTMAKLLTDIKHEIQNIEVIPLKLNFSQRLRMALKSLKEDPKIIIMKEDKGDAVVV